MSHTELVTLDELPMRRSASPESLCTRRCFPHRGPGILAEARVAAPIGAFKIRGAYAKMSRSRMRASAGVIARRVEIMRKRSPTRRESGPTPSSSCRSRRRRSRSRDTTRALGRRPVPVTERERHARRWRSDGYVMVPPYDDRDVIAGQGTVGLEIVEDLPDVGTRGRSGERRSG